LGVKGSQPVSACMGTVVTSAISTLALPVNKNNRIFIEQSSTLIIEIKSMSSGCDNSVTAGRSPPHTTESTLT